MEHGGAERERESDNVHSPISDRHLSPKRIILFVCFFPIENHCRAWFSWWSLGSKLPAWWSVTMIEIKYIISISTTRLEQMNRESAELLETKDWPECHLLMFARGEAHINYKMCFSCHFTWFVVPPRFMRSESQCWSDQTGLRAVAHSLVASRPSKCPQQRQI